jgi:hypothetical protein
MEENYKGHHIVASTRHVVTGWRPYVVVTVTEPDKYPIEPLSFKQTYSTEKEAEARGLAFAKKWIDEGKPPLGDKPIDAR